MFKNYILFEVNCICIVQFVKKIRWMGKYYESFIGGPLLIRAWYISNIIIMLCVQKKQIHDLYRITIGYHELHKHEACYRCIEQRMVIWQICLQCIRRISGGIERHVNRLSFYSWIHMLQVARLQKRHNITLLVFFVTRKFIRNCVDRWTKKYQVVPKLLVRVITVTYDQQAVVKIDTFSCNVYNSQNPKPIW